MSNGLFALLTGITLAKAGHLVNYFMKKIFAPCEGSCWRYDVSCHPWLRSRHEAKLAHPRHRRSNCRRLAPIAHPSFHLHFGTMPETRLHLRACSHISYVLPCRMPQSCPGRMSRASPSYMLPLLRYIDLITGWLKPRRAIPQTLGSLLLPSSIHPLDPALRVRRNPLNGRKGRMQWWFLMVLLHRPLSSQDSVLLLN